MAAGRGHVKSIPGRERISDDAIQELMEKGLWDTQIRNRFKVGIPRLRRIRRALPYAEPVTGVC